MATLISEIKENDVLLGINTGLNRISYSRASKNKNYSNRCYKWDGKQLDYFQMDKLIEIDGKIHCCGLFKKLIPVSQIVLNNNLNKRMDIVIKLVSMVCKMEEEGIYISLPTMESFYINECEDLILIADSIINILPEQKSCLGIYRHPDKKGEQGIAFFLCTVIYRALTGFYPFYDIRDDYLKEKIRIGSFLHIEKIIPGVSEDLAAIVNKSLRGDYVVTDSILKAVQNEDVKSYNPCTKSEIQSHIKKIDKKFHYRTIVKNNFGKSILALSAVVIFFLVLKFSIVREGKIPPTYGFTKVQVVNSYFESFNTLDVSLNMECVSSNVKRKDSDEVLVQAISNGALEMDGITGILSPEKWKELDKKESSVYGVADVEIDDIGQDMYKVKYTKYITESRHGESVLDSYYVVLKTNIEEIYYMKVIDGLWKIDGIKVIREDSTILQ